MARQKACDCCHSRKIHCDNAIPQCNWCKHHGLACTYDRVSKRAAKANARRRAGRLNDNAVSPSTTSSDAAGDGGVLAGPLTPGLPDSGSGAGLGPGSDAGIGSDPGASIQQAFGEMHFAGYELGKISSHCGIPLFSAHGRDWIKSRTGLDIGSQFVSQRSANNNNNHGSSSNNNASSGSRSSSSILADFSLAGTNLDLPPRAVVDNCLRAYRDSHFRLVFPVVDCELFPHTIDTAYAQQQQQRGKDANNYPLLLETITAKAAVFAFLAVLTGARIEMSSLGAEIDGDACAYKAQHMLPFAMLETNMPIMQTMLMLTIYHLFTGQMDNAIKMHAMTCRILYILGGHLVPVRPAGKGDDARASSSANTTWRARMHLRTVFWLCYLFDRDMCLRTGYPPCLEDEHCDLTLPSGYSEWLYQVKCPAYYANQSVGGGGADSGTFSAQGKRLPDCIELFCLPGDLRMAAIKSRTYRMLYSADALRKPDAELVHDIRELDEELERWRLSVPIHSRPQLFYGRLATTQPPSLHQDGRGGGHGSDDAGDANGACPGHGHDEDGSCIRRLHLFHRTVLHFEYHYLLATIHRAVGRCRSWSASGGIGPGGSGGAVPIVAGGLDDMNGLSSSLSLSVEASRATIFYLRLAMKTLVEDAFWHVISYPMSAILTIFGNIMMYPLHPRAQQDLELLNLTPELFKQMQPRQWTQGELINMHTVQGFVAELIRLCTHAIRKASAMQPEIRGVD